MTGFSVDFTEYDAMANKLKNWPVAKALVEIGEVGKGLIQGNFNNQSSFDGTPWRELSQVTLNARSQRGNASTLKLMDTLTLYNSIRSESRAASVILTVGNAARNASIHNDGSPNNQYNGRKAPIPARPFMPNADNIPDKWVEDFKFPVITAIERAIR